MRLTWLVLKGISAKIPKTNYLFIDYHNFIIRVIPQNYEFGIFVGAHKMRGATTHDKKDY
ncbi:hypothetical protein BVH75_29470 (plasmid) [Bacillus thuringiensis]|nr:hypothetical protein BJG91_02035 [Bacillus thuringiensis]ARX70085.1 hypothetical protein BVH75_29470 [Bacillus thuringiensis]